MRRPRVSAHTSSPLAYDAYATEVGKWFGCLEGMKTTNHKRRHLVVVAVGRGRRTEGRPDGTAGVVVPS